MSGDQHSIFRLVSPSLAKSTREAALRYAEGATECTTFFRDRGLSDEFVRKFKYGVVRDPAPNHTRFEGRISIPYKNVKGIHYISFRCPCTTKECELCANGEFKYMAATGEYRPLYNSWVLDQDLDKIYVTEGEINADVALDCGFPCIGTGSASRFMRHWSFLFDGLEEIVILRDGDGDLRAGEKMVSLWRNNLPKEVRVSLRVIDFPRGYDVASYHMEYGADALKNYIIGAKKDD